MVRSDTSGIEWRVSEAPVGYEDALTWMEGRALAIAAGSAGECIWLLEHPPLYTAGTSAQPAELIMVTSKPCSLIYFGCPRVETFNAMEPAVILTNLYFIGLMLFSFCKKRKNNSNLLICLLQIRCPALI